MKGLLALVALAYLAVAAIVAGYLWGGIREGFTAEADRLGIERPSRWRRAGVACVLAVYAAGMGLAWPLTALVAYHKGRA
jgi:hypothetical protein